MNRTMLSEIVIGTRGSKLALVQAEWVKAQLIRLSPRIEVRIQTIKTTGDVKPDPLAVIGGKGVFTKELEDALLDGRVHVAVHSLKDLPSTLPSGLMVAAICEREDARDALVLPKTANRDCPSLDVLPARTVVGTSSPRRLAQLKHLRADLVITDLRGNVDTRLRKLDEGQYGALILAAAGLRRLGFYERISLAISPEQMLPAVGQGALGLQTKTDAAEVNEIVAQLDDYKTRVACRAERALLQTLGGGCLLPIAAYGVVDRDELTLDGMVASSDGSRIVRHRLRGMAADCESLGGRLAEQLLQNGARELLA